MADKSGIEWTESTWNPVFTGEVRLVEKRLADPLRWRRPRMVFVNSMSDLFHDVVPDEFIARVFAVMALAPRHTFQVLTKRHGRMRSLVSSDTFRSLVGAALGDLATTNQMPGGIVQWPLFNVWLGVSVEDQKWADIRIPALLDTPSAVRWLSCEPLLGPIDLHWCNGVDALERDWIGGTGAPHPFVDWVVVGGESGPGARPMHPDWARSLRDECTAAGVPYFFKQWGNWAPLVPGVAPGREIRAYPGAMVQQVGKKVAGRTLDGRTWDEYPHAPALPEGDS